MHPTFVKADDLLQTAVNDLRSAASNLESAGTTLGEVSFHAWITTVLQLARTVELTIGDLQRLAHTPVEGVTRCHCGAKYWAGNTCASCGDRYQPDLDCAACGDPGAEYHDPTVLSGAPLCDACYLEHRPV